MAYLEAAEPCLVLSQSQESRIGIFWISVKCNTNQCHTRSRFIGGLIVSLNLLDGLKRGKTSHTWKSDVAVTRTGHRVVY